MRLRALHLVTIVPVLLSACAGVPQHTFLPAAARDKIATTDVQVPVRQNEIYVFVPQSNIAAAGGGGLLLALIDAGVDSVRTTKAEDAVKPLRDAIVDYNFDGTLQADLKTSLSTVSWVHADNFHVMKDVTNDSLDGALAQSKDSAVLFATTDYHLDNDGNVLSITMSASLFPNSDDLRAMKPAANGRGARTAMANALYHNSFTFETRLAGATDDRDHNMQMWSADHGAPMRDALKMGADKLAAMLAADMQRDAADPVPTGRDVTLDLIPGQVVGSDADGSIVLLKDGSEKYASHSVL